MSFIDDRWSVWDAKALTTDVWSLTAENFFDLEENGVTDESIADGLWFNLLVGVAAGGMDSGAIITVATSDSATFASGIICLGALGSVIAPLTAAQMVAGARFALAMPRWDLHKYLAVHFDAISEAATGLTVDAWFGLDPIGKTARTQKAPSGYTM